MNIRAKKNARKNGAVLIVVMVLTLLGVLCSSTVAWCISSRARQAYMQICLEQAFYIASAGAERAASNVANGNEASTVLTGTLANGSYRVTVTCSTVTGIGLNVEIASVGTVGNVSHTVSIHGVRHVSWARYALWYNSEAMKLWMVPGEVFKGPVASKPQLHFSDSGLPSKPQVHFYGRVYSGASTIEKASSSVHPVFDQGIVLGASIESIQSIDFDSSDANSLLSQATSDGLVLEGPTTIVANGATLTITNSRKGWSSKAVSIPDNGLIYVKTVKVVSGGRTTTYTGDLTMSAPSGLTGRLTVVADDDIQIANHIRYTTNPTNNPASTDALGMIAKQDVVVLTGAPNNLDVYSHIICQNGGFGVNNYNSGSSRGFLNVIGGIVNSVRNAVGTTSPSGYVKNYIYDTRFAQNPPPAYPNLPYVLQWTSWEG